jgi:hypothetical protein
MLNWPKIVNAVSTKVLLQFFSPNLPFAPIHIFYKEKLGDTWARFALITFHVMNVLKGT